MTDTNDTDKKVLSLSGKGTLSLKGGAGAAVRQNLIQGRGKTVTVEVRRKRAGVPGSHPEDTIGTGDDLHLTAGEKEARLRALQQARIDDERRQAEDERRRAEEQVAAAATASAESAAAPTEAAAPARKVPLTPEELRRREIEEMELIEAEERRKSQEAERLRQQQENQRRRDEAPATTPAAAPTGPGILMRPGRSFLDADAEEEESFRSRMKRSAAARTPAPPKAAEADRRRTGKLNVNQVLRDETSERDRGPSMAALRRQREKARLAQGMRDSTAKVTREVVVPETITVQDLAGRMAERTGDVIKCLMRMGVMATLNQVIDADTAELVIGEFGHKIKRVAEDDIEQGLEGLEDLPEDLIARPPVVTIMGHVDHGKTSLLDALRMTDVVSGEAGGITQHIGAYQVTLSSGAKVTFLDTPGHAAFTEMRARGANVTDIVVLVVAANDSIMPQTIEAIRHAKAAQVPIIVAINKVDLPDANPAKVKQDLLQHEIVVEEMGGETLCVEVSAKKRLYLDKLVEAILLQSEVLDLKANPNRAATGTVVEAKLEQGRGSVATVLVQRGTLRVGDVFVVGSEWGRVRALLDDRGQPLREAIPGRPVEVLGLSGTPEAGDRLVVLADESKARQVSDYRARKKREAATTIAPTSFESMLAKARTGGKKELAVVVKADVHGSVEALVGSLQKITEDNEEIAIRVLHSGVGGITETDVSLARASHALIIGFNVRANTQARELATRDHVEIRYYNIIYNVIDDAKAILSGMLSPTMREDYLGNAEIRQVFNITKVGKVGGCMVTSGVVKRGSKVRLLRDHVVIHEGTLKTLKRFKDEVREVREGMECGMAFENYDDIREGDVIECFDVVSEARTLA